jgi:glycosyltransferase involved in cell wall biosynthesis
MVKVCHISTVHSAFDGRIFHKECCSLAKAGYDVSLVISHAKDETVNGVHIKALKQSKNRFHRIFIQTWFAFFKALKTKSKIYHFHDPELMFVGVWLRLLGKKVIFDSHENVSNQIESKSWLGDMFVRKGIKNIYRIIEKLCVLFYARVISVTPEIVKYISPKKGILIRNYPILDWIENVKSGPINEGVTTFIYVGGLTRIRGIKEISASIGLMKGEAELLLLGPWESDVYKKECIEGHENVKYLGVKTLENVYKVMKTADVGIAILHPEKNYLNSLPIKAFEYMICELPIIMSNFPYWEDIFDECSLFVDPFSKIEITDAVEWMIVNSEERKEKGRQGKVIVKEKYSWEAEAKVLVKMYNDLSCK